VGGGGGGGGVVLVGHQAGVWLHSEACAEVCPAGSAMSRAQNK